MNFLIHLHHHQLPSQEIKYDAKDKSNKRAGEDDDVVGHAKIRSGEVNK